MKKILTFLTLSLLPFIIPLPAFAAGSCDGLTVVGGNNTFVPATVSFHARAADPAGAVRSYKFYFGDGTIDNALTPDIKHTYNVSGTFTAKVYAQDSTGAYVTSNACQTVFSLLTSPFESQKSGCGNVFIQGSDTVPAGTTVQFLVTGYDNKSGLKGYKIDFGNGQIKQDIVGNFSLTFDTPGTYTVTGSVEDSKGNWVTANSCQTPLYVTGAPIAVQPDTGTPTWFTILGVISGTALFFIVYPKIKPRG